MKGKIKVSDVTTRKYKMGNEPKLVGRDRECDVRINSFCRNVSNFHCEFGYNDGFYVRDLDSSFGTYVNQERLRDGEKKRLKDGDIVTLANPFQGVAIYVEIHDSLVDRVLKLIGGKND